MNAKRRNGIRDPVDKTKSAGGQRRKRAVEESARVQRLDYIHQMLKELRSMADESGEKTLVYLLDVAMLEVSETIELRDFRTEMRN